MKKNRYKLSLISIAIFAVFIIMIIVLNLVLFINFGKYIRFSVKLTALISELMMLILIFAVFWRYIYVPLNQLNHTLDKLENVHDKNAMIRSGTNFMEARINSLFEELMQSMEREHAEAMLRQQFQYAELQNQINPHFLYNTLETIRGQAIIDDNYKIADMTETLAKYFRYNISKNKDDVTVEQELDNIKNYIHIQQYRFQDRFRYQVYAHIPREEYAFCLIPKMTLQPIVENAIFHGIEQKLEPGNIVIHVDATQDKLMIIVSDDGVGMSAEKLAKLNKELSEKDHRASSKEGHHGIAMANVHSRLQMLYGEDFGLRISSTQGLGTEVEITFPKIMNKEKENCQ